MVTIRPATVDDAGDILTIQRAAWVTEGRLHDTFDLPPLTQTLEQLREELPAQSPLVAIDGHRVVGTVRARRADDVWIIVRLGVVPDRQGSGIGRQLLAAIEDAAPSGIRTFELFTGPKSLGNVAMYERAGYRRVPSDDGLIHLHKSAGAEPPSD